MYTCTVHVQCIGLVECIVTFFSSVMYISHTSLPQPLPSLSLPPHISIPSPLPITAASKQLLQQQRKAVKKSASAGSKPLALPQGSKGQKGLFSLHKDVGQSNSQLNEPQTPEFKPSPEWVSVSVCVCVYVCDVPTPVGECECVAQLVLL